MPDGRQLGRYGLQIVDWTELDVVELDWEAGRRTTELIDGVPSERWEAPTPCAGWTVRDVVVHLVAGNVKYTEIARGADFVPGAPDVLVDENPAGTYRRTLEVMLTAWREPGALEREVGLPRGQRGPAKVAAWIHLGETVVHGWDVARATRQDAGFGDDLVAAVFAYAQQTLPPQRGQGSPFGDARSADGHSLIDQLAAYLGRDVAAPGH